MLVSKMMWCTSCAHGADSLAELGPDDESRVVFAEKSQRFFAIFANKRA